MPNTPYTINFEAPSVLLIHDHVLNCLVEAGSQLIGYVERHGNRPIPGGRESLIYRYQTVAFEIEPAEPAVERPLSYLDAAAVLIAYAIKMSQDGYRQRSAEIFLTDGGQRVGDAFFGLVDDGKNALGITLLNPYPMPGTPFSLDFHDDHGMGPPLDSGAVINCLTTIRHEVAQRIQRYGNRPLASLGYRISNLDFDIVSAHGQAGGPVTYQDFLAVLGAFAQKMSREGYRARYALILMTHGGEFIGDAQILSGNNGGSRTVLNSTVSV